MTDERTSRLEGKVVKRIFLQPSQAIAQTVGMVVLVRLSFALLRYTTDLKFAPATGFYLEEGMKNTGLALMTVLAIRSRLSWYWLLLFMPISSMLAALLYRPVAASLGREFCYCLNPLLPPTPGSFIYSLVPALFLVGVFSAGYAFGRRWK